MQAAQCAQGQLLDTLSRWADSPEIASQRLPGLILFKDTRPGPPRDVLLEPCLGLLVQGEKQLVQGDTAYLLDRDHYLVSALDLPISMQVTQASSEQPYLALMLKLNLAVLGDMALRFPPVTPLQRAGKGILYAQTPPELLGAASRYVALLDQPAAVPFLAPLYEQEIYYYLLSSPAGERLRQLVSAGTQHQRIARAVTYLTQHYRQPFDLAALLAEVRLSEATFYRHFRQATGMSPLQFQKWLRLSEARRLMLSEGLSAVSAAFQVGYESATQFNREYRRMFGITPARNMTQLRQQLQTQQLQTQLSQTQTADSSPDFSNKETP